MHFCRNFFAMPQKNISVEPKNEIESVSRDLIEKKSLENSALKKILSFVEPRTTGIHAKEKKSSTKN